MTTESTQPPERCAAQPTESHLPVRQAFFYCVEGPMGSGKTSRLVEITRNILAREPSDSLLVLCSNHARKTAFTERLLAGWQRPLGQIPVYTYSGLVRTTLFDFWPRVEARLMAAFKHASGRPVITPVLSGMEDSELLLKIILDALRQEAAATGKPTPFEDFPGHDSGLVKQLLRRIRLRAENALTRAEMSRRSQLIAERWQEETAQVEKRFDELSLKLRVLDNSRQLEVFAGLLEQDPLVREAFTSRIRHLIVDDVDETIPAQQGFIRLLAPHLETLVLAADLDGGSRRGYLNAYPYDWPALKQILPGVQVEALGRADAVAVGAARLLANWGVTEPAYMTPLPAKVLHEAPLQITRVEMLDAFAEDLQRLLDNGTQPGEIALLIPRSDSLRVVPLLNRLHRLGIPYQLLSGTARPTDNPSCRAMLNLLQLANLNQWRIPLSPLEFRAILVHLLRLQTLDAEAVDRLTEAFALQRALPEQGQTLQLPDEIPMREPAALRYKLFRDWVLRQDAEQSSFKSQLYSAFAEIIAPYATEADRFHDLQKIIASYEQQKLLFDGLQSQPGFSEGDVFSRFEAFWLWRVKLGEVADSPEMPEEIRPDAVLIATPQKLIDYEIRRDVQCWLDVASNEWSRSDDAPLYNAWIHSAVWDGSTTALEEDFREAVIRARAGHITRTLMLLAGRQVRAYASELDDEGRPGTGHLRERLFFDSDETEADDFPETIARATLRPDQKPILDYRQGTMAITAVPGAGKTFVNVELILELVLEAGLEPQQILVLTYMESAAQTLLRRLRAKLGSRRGLPMVSTIHALAFRIITENDHAIQLGYNPDEMTILDDQASQALLEYVAAHTPQQGLSPQDWANAVNRGVKHAKTHGLSVAALERHLLQTRGPADERLMTFLEAYRLYEAKRLEMGALDFTDLIVQAVSLLETFPDLCAHYRTKFRVIIEDEAQDSSMLLQRFIRLIGGETPNLIRTGDTNQSITTTFSTADTRVFREFITNADKTVQMDRSGRCAPEIIQLANQWLDVAGGLAPALANAFVPVTMKPVEGFNPSLLCPPTFKQFLHPEEESLWVVDRIQALRSENPGATIAVLLSTNNAVTEMTAKLQRAKIPAISLSDALNLNPVFNLITAWLQVLLNPMDADWRVALYESLINAKNPVTAGHDESEQAAYRQWLRENNLFYQGLEALPADDFLLQLYYDWLDFNRDAASDDIPGLILRLTDHCFSSVADRSNGMLCAVQAQEALRQFRQDYDGRMALLAPLEVVAQHFDRARRGRKRGFPDDGAEGLGPAFVQVMTIHKSKGQEFDIVFMPGLSRSQFPHSADDPTLKRIKEEDRLVLALDRLRLKGKVPQDALERQKIEKIEEKARLLYVGFTRAKRALFCTTSTLQIRFKKEETIEPCLAFEVLRDYVAKNLPHALKSSSEDSGGEL